MHKTIVTAIAAFILGSITTGVLIARAQQAGTAGGVPMPPPISGPAGGPPTDMIARDPWMGPGRTGPGGGAWGDRMRERRAGRMELMRAFALIYRTEDRKLTPPDVQKIAEAFLRWNGNHTWKVLNAAAYGDVIGFDLATPEGSVIAHFSMDPKTGRLRRLG
jgi:hypothetical protein